jgi:flavodoxin
MKPLVLFYSLTGKTKLVATGIGKALKAEVKEVEEEKKRSLLGAYLTGSFSAIKEKCSKIKPVNLNWKNFDLIFIGTPVWASKPVPAINAIISAMDLSGKNVVLFATLANSGDQEAIRVLTKAVELKGGKVVNSFTVKTIKVSEADLVKRGEEIGNQCKK